jgi:hypothetical protein
MFCHMVEREVEDQTRIVLKSEFFAAMELFASPTPFATHIFPLRHMATFGEITPPKISDLARVLRTLLAKIYNGLENPDLNYTIRSGPSDYVGSPAFSLVSERDPAPHPRRRLRTRLRHVHQQRVARSRRRISTQRKGGKSNRSRGLIKPPHKPGSAKPNVRDKGEDPEHKRTEC